MAKFVVLCDPCAAKRRRRIEAQEAQDALRERFRDHVRDGLVGPDLAAYRWRDSNPDIEAMNPTEWPKARDWVCSGDKNLYIYGAVGVGKTWAARACLREAFVVGHVVAEVTARRLCKIADTFREGDGIFAAWKRVAVLLIDDLDKVTWTQERVSAIWELLDARTHPRKRTIVCSNLDSGALLEALKAGCVHHGRGNESQAVAALDRLKPVDKLFFTGKSQRGHVA